MRVESVSAPGAIAPRSLIRSTSPQPTGATVADESMDAFVLPEGRPPAPPEPDLATATDRLNKTAKALTSELRFSIHESTNQIVVRVVDSEGRVIREIPPERVLDAYARMLDMLGLLVDKTA